MVEVMEILGMTNEKMRNVKNLVDKSKRDAEIIVDTELDLQKQFWRQLIANEVTTI